MSADEVASRIGARRAETVADQLYERAIADVPPGVRVERVVGGIALSGRRLSERMLTDARLREIGR